MSYKHHEIDIKWQKKWSDSQTFHADNNSEKPKYYALDMFPYPSGSGLHVGHLASYTPTDIVSRYKRAQGFNVLHPMGYDAFGLPAEQYAIQTGVHPDVTTKTAITNFRRVLESFGYSFDWDRAISTCEPDFYKWTQFIFLKLFEKGLAYQTEAPVNWCPALRTVLANDEVIDGKSERGGHPVIRKPMKQWMLKITDYAERLLQDLDKVDWPERTKEAQRNWIGKSEGAEIQFKLKDHQESLEVYTTRPDTLFGVTFMVIAPEHPLSLKIASKEQLEAVHNYKASTSAKSDIDRKASTQKSGVFTGAYAIHPFTKQPIPIWISDYVLMDYGSGAIMAVPGHDERDFEFAKSFELPIVRVIDGGDLPFHGEGKLISSDFLNGLEQKAGLISAINKLEELGIGKKRIQYKLRDWLFSRQRYWGEPFPLYRDSNGIIHGVAENELPIILPEVADYQPTESGEAPLARSKDWVKYQSVNGKNGLRETDTMPGSAGSSWYFLRYIDPHNDSEPFSQQSQKYWMPVDFYLGGAEHTVGHLLYSRFWHKVLFDIGLVSCPEPFQKLVHQGLILGPDGEKMSKSRGNVVNPDDVRDNFGADAIRCYVTFMGPLDKDKPWATNGIDGVRRFLDRVWRIVCDENNVVIAKEETLPTDIEKLLHKTIKKVTEDIETLSFNTAISSMMILVNEFYRADLKPKSALKILSQLLMKMCQKLRKRLRIYEIS